jgi:hypothetical protein
MGFEGNAIKFLLSAKKENILFGKTLTLGRQSYQLAASDFFNILSRFSIPKEKAIAILEKDTVYADLFLKEIGASEVHSIDASAYEQASVIHDLNLPIPDNLKEQYDTVIDAGTLEHIFNFPTAIKNCMEMLKVNGHFIGITITNNFSGHGFYQFSPELFFRIFSEENGFETKKIFLAVNEPGNHWYEIPDPKTIKKRVLFENSKQSFLLILARKTATSNIFQHTPQQSDYEHLAWKGKDQFPKKKKTVMQKIFFFLPDQLKKRIRYKLRIFDPNAWKIFLNNHGNGKKEEFKKRKNI